MSFVSAAPPLLHGAAQDLAGIRSLLADATANISSPTTGIAAAAQDEISVAIASLFGNFGREFQSASAQAQSFHTQFVNVLNASAGAYLGAEVDAHRTLLANTAENAQTVFTASRAALGTLVNGVSTGFTQLATNPAAFFGNLQTAAQSVFLVGAPEDVTAAVIRHTLGGVTTATNPLAVPPDPTVVPVNDAHGEVYTGLLGDGYIPTGPDGLLLSTILNFASSPFSGVLLGAVGPVISPAVALWNSAGSAFADITGGNVTGALSHLINTPANVVDAFFNGATLNIDALAPVFNPFVVEGSGGAEQLTGLSFAFGGLFSPGQVVDGASGEMYYGVGGSAFNALGMDLSFFPPDDFAGGSIEIPAIPVGPIGATAGLLSILGQALGGQLP
ncbi:outer membrane porin GjpA [Mycobacterium bourgelatii]|nr:outer membrane porin GjpA [Mycobacterium bourgelatii]MCV6974341.1 PE family protein [Mycobacterium bourgelatii]